MNSNYLKKSFSKIKIGVGLKENVKKMALTSEAYKKCLKPTITHEVS